MTRTITIEPVTRIEGHAKVTLHLNDAGKTLLAELTSSWDALIATMAGLLKGSGK